ncbi:IclR family transcriptional regulator [Phytohabitans sp. LJ34]|uniref:IclR family transcriptional regulator n=1 Tax=Phytohabitans sp. LJ34 TaxID=3452217 RepID=UPI003F8CE90B
MAVQSVARAIEILRVLGTAARGAGVTEVAERIGVAKPTAHALLRTLEAGQLVAQDHETGKYRLGPALLELGNAYLETHELRVRSVAWADGLANRANEAVWVGVLSADHVLVVHHAFRPEGAVQILEVGAVIPWHTCAMGKAIVAHLPEADRAALLREPLAALTGATHTEPSALTQELDGVRATGYAVEDGEAAIGDAGIAAPVFDHTGDVVGAIGAVGPVERLLDDEVRDGLAVAVRETARHLSRDLGAGRPATRRWVAAAS